jgi:hypothetical protein
VGFLQMSDLPLFADCRAMGIAGGDAHQRFASPPGEFVHHATETLEITTILLV